MYGRSAACIDSIREDEDGEEEVRMCHEMGRLPSVEAEEGVALRRAGLWSPLLLLLCDWAPRDEARRGAPCEVGVLDGVGVSGARVWAWGCPLTCSCPGFDFDARGCGFAGTAVCVELVDVEASEGVGEDGREGVGVMDEEDSVCELVVSLDDDRCMEDGKAGVSLGIAGDNGAANDAGGGDIGLSDAKCCLCRDVSDAVRCSLLRAGSSFSYPRNCLAYVHSPNAGKILRIYTSSTFSYPSSDVAAVRTGALHANHSSMIPRPAAGQPTFALERARVTRT